MNHLDLFHAEYAVRRVQERLCTHQAKAEYKRIARLVDRSRNSAIGFRRFLTPSP